MISRISAGAAAMGATMFLAGTPAAATNYVETLDVNVGDMRCGFFGKVQSCFSGRALTGGARAAVVGDTYDVRLNLDQRLFIPRSETGATVYVTVLDNTAVFGANAPGPLGSRGTLEMDGYQGPPDPLLGPFDLYAKFSYSAVSGFCCGAPSDGFSLTGADAQIEVLTAGPNPLTFMGLGFDVGLEATPETLANFQGGAPDAPVFLGAGRTGRVTGNIGGAYGTESFYGFNWGGGVFQTQALIKGADPGAAYDFKLYRFGDYSAPIDFVELNGGNGFQDMLTELLSPGIYVVGLMTSTGVDPEFTIDFFTPVGGAFVPEPSTWAMMIAGFGAAGVMLRRRRAVAAIA